MAMDLLRHIASSRLPADDYVTRRNRQGEGSSRGWACDCRPCALRSGDIGGA